MNNCQNILIKELELKIKNAEKTLERNKKELKLMTEIVDSNERNIVEMKGMVETIKKITL